jgi:hypothetical protein
MHNKDPLFVALSVNNFALQPTSPAIDKGGPLTYVTSPDTNSRTLIVHEAGFFQDGWAGVIPDCVAVGSVSNVSCISSINYDTDTITLKTPISWKTGDPVYLYSDSSGRRVLYGTAPDIGAYEYTGSVSTNPPPPPPTPLTGDFNHDGAVNTLDFSLMVAVWNQSSPIHDLNKDGMVNSLDFSILVQNWTR